MREKSDELTNVSPAALRKIGKALVVLAGELERGTACYKCGSIMLDQQKAVFEAPTNDGRLNLVTVAQDGPFAFGTLTLFADFECWTGRPQPNA